MYVLSASAQAADRDQEIFPIRKWHTENTAIYVGDFIYGSIFMKKFDQFIRPYTTLQLIKTTTLLFNQPF